MSVLLTTTFYMVSLDTFDRWLVKVTFSFVEQQLESCDAKHWSRIN